MILRRLLDALFPRRSALDVMRAALVNLDRRVTALEALRARARRRRSSR
jgi:hypothetical protein